MKNLKAFSFTTGLRTAGESTSKAASIPSLVHNAKKMCDVMGIITVGHHSLHVYLLSDVTAHNQTFLRICILQVLKDWRQEQPL